jgi:hypothetical protein
LSEDDGHEREHKKKVTDLTAEREREKKSQIFSIRRFSSIMPRQTAIDQEKARYEPEKSKDRVDAIDRFVLTWTAEPERCYRGIARILRREGSPDVFIRILFETWYTQ